jgi:RNA polymerase sigma-70 factor (ECF subfamily)
MSRLRPKDQELLKLVLWEELTHAQVGVVLGCSTNAVALRLHKARNRLGMELGKKIRPEGLAGQEHGGKEGPP